MANCSNCGRALSCGCQRKTASDGRAVCKNCAPEYEASLRDKTVEEIPKSNTSNLQKFIR
jgi:hypothetical protein